MKIAFKIGIFSLIVIALISFYFLPYLSVVLFLFLLVIVNELTTDKTIKTYNLILFIILSALLMVIPYATKTLTPLMNDKGFYFGYMLDVKNQGITAWFKSFSGNDILSYLGLAISSHLFGVSNEAFGFFFIISYIILIVAVRNILASSVLIFLFMYIPQYNFQGLYGNIIRQGLGLSIFMLAISQENKRKYIYGVLAGMAHFSFIICLPFYFISKYIVNYSTKKIFILLMSVYFLGGVVLKTALQHAAFISSYVSSRVTAYQDGDFGNSIVRKVVLTFAFVIIVEIIYNRLRKEGKITDKILVIRSYFIMMCSVFFLTISFQEIANRYAFDLMVFVFIFIGFYISSIKNRVNRLKVVFVLLAVSFPIYFYINIQGVQYFYFGNLQGILTDSLPVMINKLF